jgi:hypothetical protein
MGDVMIVGIPVFTFTLVHVAITFAAIGAGFVVVFGMIGSHRLPKTTALFWLMTVLTTATGFMFFLSPTQAKALTPATSTGIAATILFLFGLVALYARHLYGKWRWIYTISAVLSLYLNVFVLIVQTFEKVKLINPAAPMVGPPFSPPTDFQFAVAQGAALVLFIMLGIITTLKFRRGPGLT